MKRSDFLKKLGIGLIAPSIIAKSAPSKLPTIDTPKIEQPIKQPTKKVSFYVYGI
jgi:hypothetical protein